MGGRSQFAACSRVGPPTEFIPIRNPDGSSCCLSVSQTKDVNAGSSHSSAQSNTRIETNLTADRTWILGQVEFSRLAQTRLLRVALERVGNADTKVDGSDRPTQFRQRQRWRVARQFRRHAR